MLLQEQLHTERHLIQIKIMCRILSGCDISLWVVCSPVAWEYNVLDRKLVHLILLHRLQDFDI